VAVTRTRTRTRTKTSSKATLLALSGAALALPGVDLHAGVPASQSQMTSQFGLYEEEGGRMEAQVYHGEFVVPINDSFELTFSFDQDTYVGATPYYSKPAGSSDAITAASNIDPLSLALSTVLGSPRFNELLLGINTDIASGALSGVPGIFDPARQEFVRTEIIKRLIETPSPDYSQPVQVIAAHPLESRNMPILGANFYWGPVTLGLSGGYSIEDDFNSTFGSGNVSWELNNKLTTLSVGFSLSNNDIVREAIRPGGPHDHSTGELEDFEASNKYRTFNLGLSQILTKNTLFHLNGSYTRQRGYLSNPYKLVNITGEITPEEYNKVGFIDGADDWSSVTDLEVAGFELFRDVRPEKRDIWTISTGINQYIPSLDASLHLDYRFFFDDWDINSHTFEFAWYQSLPFGITVTPNIRYYSQSGADFFAPFFRAPRQDGNYSSDYRLSSYGVLSGGLSAGIEFAKGIKLDTSFEYSTHRGSLKLGGGGIGNYADLDSYLISASLQVDMSSLGRAIGSSTHKMHAGHAGHIGHPPAGVMFGHMLGQAGDMMVGYSYKYSDWSTGMQQGTRAGISDQELIDNACKGGVCEFKADGMAMHMHMVNFMYAPTDWLNLMLMPQFAYKKMDMKPLPNSGVTEAGYHGNNGLGDTLFGGLVKIFNTENQYMHLGIIGSAPTGRIDVTFNNFINDGSQLQSFGMQLGSGTWDLKPSLTYSGKLDSWYWGAQATGTKRLQHRNRFGYVLGDEIEGSLWGGYRALDWLSFSVRNIYKVQGAIRGGVNRIIPVPLGQTAQLTPLENPANKGGQFWDVGLGMSLSVPSGEYAGHSLNVEWLQPVIHDLNGYQLERDGTLSVRWGYAF